ncbi:nitroreductase family protein [Barnesiella propionica]|uniref:nitroreductase family protein n=1 Tax=Barnesiella propionica TaxID=2981781 RepID=UPI0011C7302D|nr:nitroreductase family protein [Barnesiella propionica]MCU6768004.1 nitroreductase family protein [Barnesiella propionica]
MLDTLKNRRTIRKYSNRDISDELLNELLEISFRAPTTGNMQVYSVVITRDTDNKKKLAPAHFNQPTVTQAPVVLTFCADFNRFIKWCRYRNANPGYENFQSFVTAALDAVIVTQQFNTAAEAVGLGCCYLGTTTYNAPQIVEILNLPRYVIPITTLTVGYPEDIPEQTERLPLEAIVHYETYSDYSKDDIDRLYLEKESDPANKQYIIENQKETLAQIFTDIRYTKENNEIYSKVLLDLIKKQGFEF